jgi:hypothetical protein
VVEVAHHAHASAKRAAVVRPSAPSRGGGRRQDPGAARPSSRPRPRGCRGLSQRYTLEQLCELAAERTQVSTAVFSPSVGCYRGSLRHSFCRTRLGAEGCRRFPGRGSSVPGPIAWWRGYVHPRRRAVLRRLLLPGPEAPGNPSPPRPSERHRPPPFNAGRNGPSASLLSLWHSSLNLALRPVIGTATFSRPHVRSLRIHPMLLREPRRQLNLIGALINRAGGDRGRTHARADGWDWSSEQKCTPSCKSSYLGNGPTHVIGSPGALRAPGREAPARSASASDRAK